MSKSFGQIYMKKSEIDAGTNYLSDYSSISQLGIQTIPGVKFFLKEEDPHPIIIGKSGIFELEVINGMNINYLKFDPASFSTDDAYVIIDVLGEELQKEEGGN